jgi:anti-anti-sigma factor
VTLTFTRPATDALVVAAEGTLDERNSETLVTETHRAMDAGVGRVVIDCSSLRYVSSFGLGAMVRLHKRLADRGRGLTLAAVSPRLLTELRLVRLSDVFVRTPTVEAALSVPPEQDR